MSKQGAPGICRGYQLHGLAEVMKSHGVNRAELARLSGINYTTLWRLESGKFGASAHTISQIAKALGVQEEALKNDNRLQTPC